ncbi:MAG: KamA family radical SAM protein [Chloroflexota bacterium]
MKPVYPPVKYRAYNAGNFRLMPQMVNVDEHEKRAIEIVSQVLPFKVNNYVAEHLIDWANYAEDPIYAMTFPRRDMLSVGDFTELSKLRAAGMSAAAENLVHEIRLKLNPHPASQIELNVPRFRGAPLEGIQHKYRETALAFPAHGQSCHAFCSFCFRWPQFTSMPEKKFSAKDSSLILEYLIEHKEIVDLLITGGDPLIMNFKRFSEFLDPILNNIARTCIKTIRIGTKALTYWPYKFLSDPDTDHYLRYFESIGKRGLHLSIMAHVNHHCELSSPAAHAAVKRILSSGAQIRTQSPVLRGINDSADLWAEKWRSEIILGMVPYYFFVARDTGPNHYFSVPLERAWEIFKEAQSSVSGLCRTARGPTMSAAPGKIIFDGVAEIAGEKRMAMHFTQARDPEMVNIPFFAKYDPKAVWISELRPAEGEKFFWQKGSMQVI